MRVHLAGLLRYATVLTGDGHTAADLVQEVLLRAHVRWTRIALMERPDLYLRRMVTNEHLSWRRRWHVRTIRPAADEVLAAHADVARRPRRRTSSRRTRCGGSSRRCPRGSAPCWCSGTTRASADAEIAQVLGTSPATVRSHATRALATLRDTDLSTRPEQR